MAFWITIQNTKSSIPGVGVRLRLTPERIECPATYDKTQIGAWAGNLPMGARVQVDYLDLATGCYMVRLSAPGALSNVGLIGDDLKPVYFRIHRSMAVCDKSVINLALNPGTIVLGQPAFLIINVESCRGVWVVHPDGRREPASGNDWAVTLRPTKVGPYKVVVDVEDQDTTHRTKEVILNVLSGPIPLPTSKPQVGLNALGDMRNGAEAAIQNGCKTFTVTHNEDYAIQMKRRFPSWNIIMRPFLWPGRMPIEPDEMPNRLKVGELKGYSMIYSGLNEADHINQDPSGIRTRAAFDRRMAEYIKSINPSAIYTGGSFSMGCPNFLNQEVCDTLRECYAPMYNSGLMWFDMHLYSPNMGHLFETQALAPDARTFAPMETTRMNRDGSLSTVVVGLPQVGPLAALRTTVTFTDAIAPTDWYETRWRFLFRSCGFDPNSPSRITATEIGVDEGGVGGFPAHNATPAQVLNYHQRWAEIQGAPFLCNGVVTASPVVMGTTFQVGGTNQSWGGYECIPYLDALGTLYKTQ